MLIVWTTNWVAWLPKKLAVFDMLLYVNYSGIGMASKTKEIPAVVSAGQLFGIFSMVAVSILLILVKQRLISLIVFLVLLFIAQALGILGALLSAYSLRLSKNYAMAGLVLSLVPVALVTLYLLTLAMFLNRF
jgi:hypothetical protein